ncbi:hypothetical protein MYX78_03345, partial [Acidobacteria bacterium AH-259-G07]|nr:hypothetical protein [Acidobacteria bacterium AH-259-G07]
MNYQVLINDTVKEYLLGLGSAKRRQLHKAFEFLESGLWDGGLRVKKLRSLSQRAIMEGRLNQSERLLFTLGKGQTAGSRDIYVWGIARHGRVDQKAQAVVPHNAPFLNFESYTSRELDDVDFDELRSDCVTQESVHLPTKL